jgi:TctA family transporter
MDPFLAGMSILLDPYNLSLIVVGLLIGTVVGVLPGSGRR